MVTDSATRAALRCALTEVRAPLPPPRRRSRAGARARLMVAYAPVPGSKLGELAGQHDLVLGYTPEERPDGSMAAVDRRAR